MPHLSGALFLPSENMLLIADLHLEQGTSLARRGLHVPPYDTAMTLDMLEQVLGTTRAKTLVLLGDSFHDSKAHDEIATPYAERLRHSLAGVETIWISGNHDPISHTVFGGRCVEELAFGKLVMRHIPARRLTDQFEIAGHLHPGASIVQRGHLVRGKAFVADGARIIMPAFGSYTGALGCRTAAFKGLLDADNAQAWLIGKAAIHRFPFKRLA